MSDTEHPELQDADKGITRREFCVKGAVVVGAATVVMYVPPKLTHVVLPSAFAKAAPANKESCEKDPIADKDPNEKDPSADKTDEKDPNADKDPNEKDEEGKDPNADKDQTEKTKDYEGTTTHSSIPNFLTRLKDEWS
jgi:hypothetical protein